MTEEVDRILTATVRVIERMAPEQPRVSDIVAEAGLSNKAFYRYFAGKDELIMAVMERGVGIIVSYLERQMGDETDPALKITRWIEGTMAQATEPWLVSMSQAAARQLSATANRQVGDRDILAPLRVLLSEPVAALGGAAPEQAADAVFLCTTGTLRRNVGAGTRSSDADIAHLVTFCLRGLAAGREATG